MKKYEFQIIWLEATPDEILSRMGNNGWHIVGCWQHKTSEFTVRIMAMMEREVTEIKDAREVEV